jgi:transposase InsO family protein
MPWMEVSPMDWRTGSVAICWAARRWGRRPSTGRSQSSVNLFKEYGLPRRIRTDNGVPFAATTSARLSKLSAWWVRLGILPEFIEPGKPAQNGRHERMHRTLKAETTRPAAGGLAAQQRRFNVFRLSRGVQPRAAA